LRGFEQGSYGEQVVTALPAPDPPGFCAALVGPIAILNPPPADAIIGLAMVATPIPISCSKRRRMIFMICLQRWQ
jgi:hypothetical protein